MTPRSGSIDPARDAVRLKIFLSSILLLLTALGFNALFNFSTLEKLYTESAAVKYQVLEENLRYKIQQSLLSGQNIQNIKGITDLLDLTKKRIENFSLDADADAEKGMEMAPVSDFNVNVSICLPSGQILYSTQQATVHTTVSLSLEDPNKKKKEKRAYLGRHVVTQQNGLRFLQLPVRDFRGNWVATVVISFEKDRSDGQFKEDLKKQIPVDIGLLGIGILLLIFFLMIAIPKTHIGQEIPQKRYTRAMFFIIGPILILFSGLNTYHATKQYLDICRKKAGMTLALAKEEIEPLLRQNLLLETTKKRKGQFLELIKAFPVLDTLIILDDKNNWILGARQEDLNNQSALYKRMGDFLFSKFSFLNSTQKLKFFKEKNQPASGTLIVRISEDQFVREVVNMILNAITVFAISILFLIEILIFIFHFMDTRPVPIQKDSKPIHYGLIRPVTFLFLFGIDISISFIPLHMGKLYTPMLGLSRDAIMGFPISVEFLFVGIAIFFCGFWTDRRGWHEPFLAGLFLAGTGVLYSWLAPDMIHFIISRAIVGIGYGLTLLAAQGFVIAFSNEKTRSRAFSQFIAGLYAGSICGGATGALLAEKFGYGWVFFIGAIILYSTIVYSLIFMHRAMTPPKRIHPAGELASVVGKSTFSNFLKNRIVLCLILLSSLPASIAAVGFLNYFSPIYLNRIGATQATIGRVIMIYGFSLVYLGPVIGKFVDKFDRKKNYIFVGCLIGSIAFLMFYFLDGLLAATIAIFLLGLSNSFIIASQSTYLLTLKVTHALGAGKAIGIFRATSRIGQALGPIVFSGLFLSTDIRISITKFGLLYLLTAILFLVFTLKDKNQYERSSR